MVDHVTPERRSWLMSRVRGENTKPEMVVRSMAHRLGFRFRLHRRELPGRPDLVFPGRKKVIFVHGCFWHRHPGCSKATMPKSNVAMWKEKFARNVARDAEQAAALKRAGWRVLVVWQCETADEPTLEKRLTHFLSKP